MFTLNGTGIRLYGKDKINPDKSHISTKWVTFFWIPLIPLGSFRVWKDITQNSGLITYGTETKYRMQKVALNFKQIFKVYSVTLLILASFWIIGYLIER